LKGKGIPISGGSAGDMYAKLIVMLPEDEDNTLTNIIEKWAKKNAYDPRKKLGW
jgi:DnaJ-class molecular chaperone